MPRDIYDVEDRQPPRHTAGPGKGPVFKPRSGDAGSRALRYLVPAALWLAFLCALLLTTVKVIRTLSLPDVGSSDRAIQDQLRPSR